MSIINKCSDGVYRIFDVPVEVWIESFKKEDKIRKKKLIEAYKACKKVVPPKRHFYKTDRENKSYIQKFVESDATIFECPHCDEPYYLTDEYYDGYIDKEECIPTKCDLCGNRMDIHQKIEWFGNWAVTLYGIENLNHDYNIHYSRLNQMNWIEHIEEKRWANVIFFAQAYTYAKMFFYPDQFLTPYQKYLRSDHWKSTKQQALNYYGNCCVLCANTENINVHHRNYDHLGKEEINRDLIVLCKKCHSKFHDKG